VENTEIQNLQTATDLISVLKQQRNKIHIHCLNADKKTGLVHHTRVCSSDDFNLDHCPLVDKIKMPTRS